MVAPLQAKPIHVEIDETCDQVALGAFEAAVESLSERVDLGTVSIGCALGYLDFRFAEIGWRRGHPRLADWFARFDQRPRILRCRSAGGPPAAEGVRTEGASAPVTGCNASSEGAVRGLSADFAGLAGRVTRAGVPDALSGAAVEAGGAKRRLGGIAVASSSRPADEDPGGVGALFIGDATSATEDFGRPRGRPTCLASVVGLDLRSLADFMTGIFAASLDGASRGRLF